ncbi:MAG: nucleotidyltransferase family protein [Anaerolineales bacterium]|nr:nucleotidyltransferase family protein [Anaerolineales bacterium]
MNKPSRNLDELLAKIRNQLPTLREQHHVRTLEVFGSFVRGEEKENSDLDLLVTFDEIPSLFSFVALENQLSDALGMKVDLVMKDSLKPFIGKFILEEARPI